MKWDNAKFISLKLDHQIFNSTSNCNEYFKILKLHHEIWFGQLVYIHL